MTIEELCECSSEQLEQMTDSQLLEYFKPFLTVTRPEYAARERAIKKTESQKPSMPVLSPQKQAALRQLSQECGMEFDFLLKRKKK